MSQNDDDNRLKNAAQTIQALKQPAEVDFEQRPMPAPNGTPPESIFGARIQAVRNHFGLSVDALSRVTKEADEHENRGLSATALLRYEDSGALPGGRELRLLCDALGVSADWLLTGSNVAGIDAAEREALEAQWRLFRFYERRSGEMGGGVMNTTEAMARMKRHQRIADAKRRRSKQSE